MESPLEIKRDRAHATSKHQSRLRCRWTLCPFITHALNLLAVISLATGEGIRGYLTSCSPGRLGEMVKRAYFSQLLLLSVPSSLNGPYRTSFPVSDKSSAFCSPSVCLSVFISPPTCLSLAPILSFTHTYTHTHTRTHTHTHTCRVGIWVPWQQGTSKSN